MQSKKLLQRLASLQRDAKGRCDKKPVTAEHGDLTTNNRNTHAPIPCERDGESYSELVFAALYSLALCLVQRLSSSQSIAVCPAPPPPKPNREAEADLMCRSWMG